MAEPDSLTLAFLDAHPQDAARELERLPPPQAAELFVHMPARVVAPVLHAMLARSAADCVAVLQPDRASLVLGALNATAAAAILRHLTAERRKALLDALPTAAALACRALLRYPEDAVGAVAEIEVVARPAESSVEEALQALRDATVAAHAVYVVGNAQRLLGTVEIGALLRAAPTTQLADLMRPAATLSALMPIASAVDADAFASSSTLAVVEHNHRLLGAVSLARLRRHAQQPDPGAVAAGVSVAGLVANGYWDAVAGLAEATVSALTPSRTEAR